MPRLAAAAVLALHWMCTLGSVHSQDSRQQRGFCVPVPNAITTRVNTPAGGKYCRTMWCLSPTDGADSRNCRCERAPSEVCDRLGYDEPEPEPEPEPGPARTIGSAEQNARRSAECEGLVEGSREHTLYDCQNAGEVPKLYWLFVIMAFYLVFATCAARIYKKMRSRKESQFYRAIRDGTVRIEALQNASDATELDMRMEATAGPADSPDSARGGGVHDHELGVGKAAGDLIGDVTSVLGITALTEVGHAMGDKVGGVVTNVEGLALGTVDNVEKHVGKLAEKQVNTIGALLFGDFISISKKEMAENLGTDSMIYLMHLKQCGVFFLKASATYMPVLIFCYQNAEYENSDGALGKDWSMYSFTAGALQNERNPSAPGTVWSWVAATTAFVFSLHSLYFAYSRWKKLEKLKIGAKAATSSKNTIMLKNIPKKVTTNDLLERYFAQACPDQVQGVRVALNVHGLCINVRQQKHIYRQLNTIRQAAPWLTDANNYGTNKDEARLRALHGDLIVELHQLEAENARLRQHEPEGAGCAFVTFKSEAYAKSYFAEAKLHNGRVAGDCNVSGDVLVVLQRAKWEIHMAPLQHDIYWENLAVQESEALVRKVGTNSVLIGLLTLFALATFAAVLFIGLDFMQFIWRLALVTDGVQGKLVNTIIHLKGSFTLLGFYMLFGLPPLLLFLALAEATPLLVRFVSRIEHTQTRTEQQSAYLTKCYFYYMVLHLWCGSCGFILLTSMVSPEDRLEVFLTLASLYHLHKFFLEIFVYLPLRVLDGVSFFFRPTREISVTELGDAAEEEDAEFAKAVQHDEYHNAHFDYSRQYGETLALFAMGHVWAIACPPIMFLCGSWFMAKYAVDKYILTKHYSRARISYGRRARMITKWTLASVMIGQICVWQLFRVIGRESEAKLVMVSCFISIAAFVVYINRKFKIPGTNIEVNLVGFVMKHSPLGKLKYTQGINNVMNEFHESDNNGDEDDEDDPRSAQQKAAERIRSQDMRRPDEPVPVLYDVPTLDTLRYAVEAEQLWEPGMAYIDNPLTRSSLNLRQSSDTADGTADSGVLSHLQKRKLEKDLRERGGGRLSDAEGSEEESSQDAGEQRSSGSAPSPLLQQGKGSPIARNLGRAGTAVGRMQATPEVRSPLGRPDGSGPSRAGLEFLEYRSSIRRFEPVVPARVANSVVEEDV